MFRIALYNPKILGKNLFGNDKNISKSIIIEFLVLLSMYNSIILLILAVNGPVLFSCIQRIF